MNDEPAPDQRPDLETLLAERIAEYRLCLLPLEDALLEAAERLAQEGGASEPLGGVGLAGEGGE